MNRVFAIGTAAVVGLAGGMGIGGFFGDPWQWVGAVAGCAVCVWSLVRLSKDHR